MKDYQKLYKEKLTTPEEAVKCVKSGDWIDYLKGLAVPKLLDKALAARAEELDDINIRGYLFFHDLAVYAANDRVGRNVFTVNSWHFGGFERKQVEKGYAFFLPMRYFELTEMYSREEDVDEVDVAMLQVCPMDKHGRFNVGPSAANALATLRRAKKIILEVNPGIPYISDLYDGSISIEDVDYVVESNEPCDVLYNPPVDEIDKKIAAHVLPLIPDGATLQLGIGGMPNAVGDMIAESDLKDLGIHTEMYVDSMMKMAKAGKITGKYKNIDRGKQVFAFGAGSQELYEYMDHNQEIASAPIEYVNNPDVVAKLDNFISINNAINLDLFGQVNAESAGPKQISGTGGQLDFVIGAYHSKGGKSIIALTSTFTDKKGNVLSRILPALPTNAIVTDPRTAVHYVATEYGIFNLKGKSTWQRAEGLINLAHPDFRDELIKEAEKLHIWRRSSKR